MTDQNVYTAKLIGFDEYERRVFSTIFLLSQIRSVSFSFFDENAGCEPNFLIVNFDDETAISQWQALCIENAGYLSIPNIRVQHAKYMDTENYYLYRPFTANKLLHLLDTLVERELNVDKINVFKDKPLASKTNTPLKVAKGGKAKSTEKLFNSVLLIEDSLALQMSVCAMLDNYADKIDLARTGKKALKLVTQNSYDIIFLDAVLPDADGCHIYKLIKRRKKSQTTPIIMLAGALSIIDSIKEDFDARDSHLIKPIKKELFKDKIKLYY